MYHTILWDASNCIHVLSPARINLLQIVVVYHVVVSETMYSIPWKLYHYKSSNFRFIGNTSHSDLQGYDQLDWTGELCIVTKSMKDAILYRRFGINAVAPHSESLSAWKDKIPTLQKRFAKVIINFDNS